jgi:hypothetical protein
MRRCGHRKCSMRALILPDAHHAIIVTQDMRRTRRVVTGRVVLRRSGGWSAREIAAAYGCSVIFRRKAG